MPLNFPTLRAFADSLENATQFPLKILGVKQTRNQQVETYYTATMLAAVYNDTPNPDDGAPPYRMEAPFGFILKKGCEITPDRAFSEHIVPAGDGSNIFQGDILVLESTYPLPSLQSVSVSKVMVVSHSCDVSKMPAPSDITICPIFSEHELTKELMEHIRGKAAKDQAAHNSFIQNITRNEMHSYFSVPAHGQDALAATVPDEPLVAPLALMHSIPLKNLKPITPSLRLTYRMNAYFQLRLSALLLRDVQRSDETRDF